MTTRTVEAAAPGAPAAPLHSPSSTRARWAVALSTLTIAGIVAYVALVVTAQLLPPHYNAIRTAESDLAVGRYGWLMTMAFVLRGVLSLALVAALALAARRGLRPRAGLVLLGLWGAGAFLLAAFPTDLPGDARTVHGAVHAAVAFAAFLAVAIWANCWCRVAWRRSTGGAASVTRPAVWPWPLSPSAWSRWSRSAPRQRRAPGPPRWPASRSGRSWRWPCCGCCWSPHGCARSAA